MGDDAQRPGIRRSRCLVEGVIRARAGGGDAEGAIVDLSLSGARIVRPAGWSLDEGASASLRLLVPGEVPLAIGGRVSRVGVDAIAFSFDHLAPPAEIALRDIIERRGQLRDDFDDVGEA
jgi:hypothetical protein